MYVPNSMWTWAFTAVALIQAAAVLALEGYVFGQFQVSLHPDNAAPGNSNSAKKTIPTYLSLLIFGLLYQLALVYDALRLKNTIQVIGLCLYNVGILVYTANQTDQIHDAVDQLSGALDKNFWVDIKPFLIAVPCIVAAGTVAMSFIAYKLYEEFAWTIYKHISADVKLKRRFLVYQIYIALLKFDFFFFLGFSEMFLVVVIHTSDVEFYLTIAALPVTVICLLLAAYWTRKESVFGMICIIILYFGALAYFLFKLVRMYGSDTSRVEDYLPARRSLTIFAVITILLLIVTIITACWCTHNFNKGLKPHIAKRKVTEADPRKFESEMPSLAVPSRMTID